MENAQLLAMSWVDRKQVHLLSMHASEKIFFHLLDRTMANAYITYKMNPNIINLMPHYHFAVKVVEGLIVGYQENQKESVKPF